MFSLFLPPTIRSIHFILLLLHPTQKFPFYPIFFPPLKSRDTNLSSLSVSLQFLWVLLPTQYVFRFSLSLSPLPSFELHVTSLWEFFLSPTHYFLHLSLPISYSYFRGCVPCIGYLFPKRKVCFYGLNFSFFYYLIKPLSAAQ
uniref:Uncharacterized protein n=1 Tax=Cacopsylla melanoneura TaxID=428564 RepID=A0A8D9E9I3_9HEMI